MKSIFLLTSFFAINAFAANITNCSYREQTANQSEIKIVTLVGDAVYKNLNVNTVWTRVGDCPSAIGIKYTQDIINSVEYHNIVRSELNTQTKYQTCIYSSPAKNLFSDLTCTIDYTDR